MRDYFSKEQTAVNLSADLTRCRIFCEGQGHYEVTATIVNRMATRESGHEGRSLRVVQLFSPAPRGDSSLPAVVSIVDS